MFTGIIEEVGSVASIRKGAHSCVLTVNASRVLEDVHLGDSIATNGVCLTVTSFTSHSFSADVMHETLNRSSLGSLHIGSPVNLERAMLAGGRFGGHIVSGHIDGVGTISSIKEDDNAVWYTVEAPSNILRYIIEKGSITLDGISLTVAKVTNSNFSVSIIPHTRAQTNLASKKVGDVLNLENDLVGKYVERLMLQPIAASQEQPEQKSSGITKEFLSHYGF
ncbi:riboflavin synthase alpha subunit [Eggerthella sp. CAG:368]|nr:riboflavin synthase alpha subunit [Eggerthella sp. CAG:368]